MNVFVVVFLFLSINQGSAIDPCTSYKFINKAGQRGTGCRSSSNKICDRNGFVSGWYAAMYNNQYLQMPEKSPEPLTCGTDSPIWINGSHPKVIGTNVTVNACVRGMFSDKTCISSIRLTIMKCPAFYVYHLPFVELCFLGYCFGNHSCPMTTTMTKTTHVQDTSTSPISISPMDPCLSAQNLDKVGYRGSECDIDQAYGMPLDQNLKPGWYRAIQSNKFVDMATSCVKAAHCGITEPIWLNGSLPKFEDGVVSRKTCVRGRFPKECCKETIEIFVKNCLAFNVYYLTGTCTHYMYNIGCSRAYCFDEAESQPMFVDGGRIWYYVSISVITTTFVYGIAMVFAYVYLKKHRRSKVSGSIADLKSVAPPPYLQNGYNQEARTFVSTLCK